MPLTRKSPEQPPLKPAEPDLAQLASRDVDARWAAARAAGDHPASVSALSRTLAVEADRRVRHAIFGSLVRIGSPASVEAVLPHLRSDDADLRTAALDALREMPEPAMSIVKGLLQDQDPDVRILACDLLRIFPDGKQAEALIRDVLNSEPVANVCAAAVEVLAEIGSAESVPYLHRCAGRFPDDPFLAFSIQAVAARIAART